MKIVYISQIYWDSLIIINSCNFFRSLLFVWSQIYLPSFRQVLIKLDLISSYFSTSEKKIWRTYRNLKSLRKLFFPNIWANQIAFSQWFDEKEKMKDDDYFFPVCLNKHFSERLGSFQFQLFNVLRNDSFPLCWDAVGIKTLVNNYSISSHLWECSRGLRKYPLPVLLIYTRYLCV